MRRDFDDLHAVRPEHLDIHERCLNWARYVSSHGSRAAVHPMFQHYRSSEVWAAAEGIPTDPLDGHQIEKAVGALPEKNRDAVRWAYVYTWIHPGKVCRHLAVNRPALADLVHDARAMLKNRRL
jgi:hypothetical protein